MEVVKQHTSLPIHDIGEDCETDAVKHCGLLPNNIRCIICGPSNCGKTNLLLNLLTHHNGVKFENIYIYSKSLFQPKYKLLEAILQKVPEIGFFKYTSSESIIEPQDAKPNSVFIFDDIMCDKQDVMRAYFSMGRHNSLDIFYLAQTYARIPKHLIRDNCNLIVLFQLDNMNLKHAYADYVTSDMSFAQFQQLCNQCWTSGKYGFLVINRECEKNNGRYRLGFDTHITIKE